MGQIEKSISGVAEPLKERGILTEIWSAPHELPSVGVAGGSLYFLQRGIHTVFALPLTNFVAVVTVAVSLFLFTGFLLLQKNIDRLFTDAARDLSAVVFLKNTVQEEEAMELARSLRQRPGITSVSFTSREAAMKIFQAQMGEKGEFLGALEGDNPLPPSLELTFERTLNTDPLALALRGNPLVLEVAFGSQWVDRAQAFFQVFRVFGWIIGCVLLSGVVLLISNTMRLLMYARRDEIGIMKLVGATDSFIRLPFIIGGGIQGLVGAGIALALVWLSFLFVRAQIADSVLFGVTVPAPVFFHQSEALLLLLCGLAVGALASRFAAGRFLDV